MARRLRDLLSERATYLSLKDDAERNIAALDREIEEIRVKPYWREPTAECIRYSLQYEPGGKVYFFAAIRVGRRWYTTARACPARGYTWEELCDTWREAYALFDLHALVNSQRIPEIIARRFDPTSAEWSDYS